MNKRIIALDVSKNRVGVAISDFHGIFVARSFLITNYFIENIKDIYNEYNPIETYIGLPRNLDGSISDQTRFVKEFAHNNRDLFKPYFFKDERFTTKLAKMMNYVGKSDDEVAAEILLRYQLEIKIAK
jgi:putative transcription antitermination factor YqgF